MVITIKKLHNILLGKPSPSPAMNQHPTKNALLKQPYERIPIPTITQEDDDMATVNSANAVLSNKYNFCQHTTQSIVYVNAIIDYDTEKPMKYLHLINMDKFHQWIRTFSTRDQDIKWTVQFTSYQVCSASGTNGNIQMNYGRLLSTKSQAKQWQPDSICMRCKHLHYRSNYNQIAFQLNHIHTQYQALHCWCKKLLPQQISGLYGVHVFHIDLIPSEIIQLYKLYDIVDNKGWVYIKIIKGM